MKKQRIKETVLVVLFLSAMCLASTDSPLWEGFILTKVLASGIYVLEY